MARPHSHEWLWPCHAWHTQTHATPNMCGIYSLHLFTNWRVSWQCSLTEPQNAANHLERTNGTNKVSPQIEFRLLLFFSWFRFRESNRSKVSAANNFASLCHCLRSHCVCDLSLLFKSEIENSRAILFFALFLHCSGSSRTSSGLRACVCTLSWLKVVISFLRTTKQI